MNTTQEHIVVSDIKDDIVIFKRGGGALILQVFAVNFGLLSEREQMAIIFSFAQMLNSLSFSIQIFIYSERLNINSYLLLLDKARQAQTNPLLSQMIGNYRQFIQTTIKENEVLDKKFYLVVPLYSLELGLRASKENLEQKIRTVLYPRRDQVIRQLRRVGLKTIQLDNKKLVELFYDIYNGYAIETPPVAALETKKIEVSLKQPQPLNQPAPPTKTPSANSPPSPAPATANNTQGYVGQTKTHPFVVEELEG